VDFPLIEVIDIDVVVVIRFVAMEIIPVKRVAQEKPDAKQRLRKRVERYSEGPKAGNLSPGLS
jgi:hypothetical protein